MQLCVCPRVCVRMYNMCSDTSHISMTAAFKWCICALHGVTMQTRDVSQRLSRKWILYAFGYVVALLLSDVIITHRYTL